MTLERIARGQRGAAREKEISNWKWDQSGNRAKQPRRSIGCCSRWTRGATSEANGVLVQLEAAQVRSGRERFGRNDRQPVRSRPAGSAGLPGQVRSCRADEPQPQQQPQQEQRVVLQRHQLTPWTEQQQQQQSQRIKQQQTINPQSSQQQQDRRMQQQPFRSMQQQHDGRWQQQQRLQHQRWRLRSNLAASVDEASACGANKKDN